MTRLNNARCILIEVVKMLEDKSLHDEALKVLEARALIEAQISADADWRTSLIFAIENLKDIVHESR